MTINRKFFFDHARLSLFSGKMTSSQVAGLTSILDHWESHHAADDDRWLAYMLATAHHETDRTFQPIKEYGLGKGRAYGTPTPPYGEVYYGRGFVQLTWNYNYDRCGKHLNIDLLRHPDLALDIANATEIMFYGMIQGIFTGKKLADYFSGARADWRNARRIINGTDKASLIAGYGASFYASISYTT